ncbi:MAG TPA: type II secretion system protein [Vicinamibacterales bacterium]|nr:type II secretion system protein [Vicinamibacterales bacterium]
MNGRPLIRRAAGERGYLMVALLVAMSVMAILMGAALPAYHTMARREKEAELVFRGEQYARAIGLWQQKFANQPAPSIDVLVEQRFLRKKYKDPITDDEFQLLGAGASAPGQTQQGTTPQGRGGAQGSAQQEMQRLQVSIQQAQERLAAIGGRGTAAAGGIVGVTSKSTEKSLRLYNGRDTYNQWVFMPVARGRAGAGARGGAPGPEGRGGRGVEGGRGLPQGAGPRGGVPAPATRGRF